MVDLKPRNDEKEKPRGCIPTCGDTCPASGVRVIQIHLVLQMRGDVVQPPARRARTPSRCEVVRRQDADDICGGGAVWR